jgi:hypothetical protein
VGFHEVISKSSSRFWHLRDELISHVKTLVSQTLTDKAESWLKEDVLKDFSGITEKTPSIDKVAEWSEQGLIKSNQLGERDVWLLTDDGERRKVEMNSAKPVV